MTTGMLQISDNFTQHTRAPIIIWTMNCGDMRALKSVRNKHACNKQTIKRARITCGNTLNATTECIHITSMHPYIPHLSIISVELVHCKATDTHRQPNHVISDECGDKECLFGGANAT